MLKQQTNIVRLISLLCEFLTHLTMIKSHVRSTFYTLFSLSIRLLPSYYRRLNAWIVSWAQAFEAIMNEVRIHQPAQAIWISHQIAPSLVLKTVGIICRVRRAFKAFVDLDQNLDQFVKLRVFSRCD
jgi:hypothetical protein